MTLDPQATANLGDRRSNSTRPPEGDDTTAIHCDRFEESHSETPAESRTLHTGAPPNPPRHALSGSAASDQQSSLAGSAATRLLAHPEQLRVLPFLQGAAAVAVPFLIGLYVLVSVALAEFYSVFGITFDQAGIDQVVLLSRMARVIVLLAIAIVPLTCVTVTVAWVLNRMTRGRLSNLFRAVWQRPWGQALIVMLLVNWLLADWWYLYEPRDLPWIISGLIAIIPIVTLIEAVANWLDRKTGWRLSDLPQRLLEGESRPWLVITVMIGFTYPILFLLAGFTSSGFSSTSWITAAPFIFANVSVLILVFFVFHVPFRLLRHTRYFRLVTTSIVVVLAVMVVSRYAFFWIHTAAGTLHDEGKFSPLLSQLFGVQPQIATVRWGDGNEKLVPEDRKILVLGQSEEAVWLYDCVQRRTVRVSGGAIVATELVLDPAATLTCSGQSLGSRLR